MVVGLLLLLPFLLHAQSENCGTIASKSDLKVISEIRRLMESGELSSRDLGDGLIPVKYHIIAADDSSMAMDTSDMYAEMDIVQQRFAPVGIEFYQCGDIDFIYDTDYVDFEKNIDEDICDARDVPYVLNIWFADNVYKVDNGDVVSICGYAYLSGPNDRVIIDNDCGDNSSTLVHEIGHYFSLLHTHSNSGQGEEFVDGSNCLLAGDLLCDTPADPKLSSSNVNSSCIYIGSDTDSNGDEYLPNPEFIMSYSRKHCRTEFSDDQLDQMAAYLVSYRNYLACPTITQIENRQNDVLTFEVHPNPSNGVVNISYNVRKAKSSHNLQLVNVLGETLYVQSIPNNIVGTKTLNLSLPNQIPAGIYYLTLAQGQNTAVRKIVML